MSIMRNAGHRRLVADEGGMTSVRKRRSK